MKLHVGDKAPDFEAVDQSGEPRRLADYLDSWLLLYFYPKDNAPGCTRHACALRDHYDSIKHLVKVVGVSGDSAESHTRFIARHDLPFTLLSDPGRHITKRYGAAKLIPNQISYLIDPTGTVRGIFTRRRNQVADALGEAEQLMGTIFQAA